MAAKIKSLVTVREEKVFGAVDMNRMMSAGMATGFVYAMCRIVQVGLLQIPIIIFSFFFFIWLSGKKGGVPRYMVFIYSWQGRILIAARRNPNSLAGRIANLAGWTTADVIINGDNANRSGFKMYNAIDSLCAIRTDHLFMANLNPGVLISNLLALLLPTTYLGFCHD